MLNKKVLLGVATVGVSALVAINANAAIPGAYVNGILGWGDVHQDGASGPGINSSSTKDTGIAGRIAAGYQFDDTWAAELGYSKFSNATDKGNVLGLPYSATLKTSAVDLVGKASLPLQNGFSVYGKAGIAYLMESVNGSVANVNLGHDSEHKVFPTFTVGTAYDFTPNVVGDISWNRIQKVGSSDLNSTDLVGVGISYYFG